MKRHSIRTRLFAWFIVASLVPMLVMSSLSYYLIYNKIRNQNEETLTNINNGIYNMVDTQKKVLDEWLKSAGASFEDKLKRLGDNRFDSGEMQTIGGYRLPTWYIGAQKITGDFTLVDYLSESEGLPASIFQLVGNTFVRVSTNVRQPDGNRITGTVLDISGPVYEKVINRQTFLGRANVEGIMHATIYEPLLDDDGKLVGAFVLGRREQEYEMTQAIKDIVVGETGYVFVMDAKGTAIIHPTREGQNLEDTIPEVVDEILQKKNGSMKYNFDGREKIAYYVYYEPWDWYIVTGSYTSELFNTTHQLSNMLITAVAAVIMISLALAYALSSGFSKPIRELMGTMRQAQGGDLTVRISYAHTEDDFGILGRGFNTMLSTLSIMVSRISGDASQLRYATQQLMNDIADSKESLRGMDKGVDDLRQLPAAGQAMTPSTGRPNDPLLEEASQLFHQMVARLETLPPECQEEQAGALRLDLEKLKFLFLRLATAASGGQGEESTQTSYYSYMNRVNNVEVEVEKLKLLMKNIHSSAAKLEEVALSMDRHVNTFHIEEKETAGRLEEGLTE